MGNNDHPERRGVLVGAEQAGSMSHGVDAVTFKGVPVAIIEEPFAPPRQGIDHRHCFLITIGEEDVPAAAVVDVPAVVDSGAALLEGGEEEVAAPDGGGLVPVGAAGGDEGGEGGERGLLDGAGGVEEEAQEGRRVKLAEAAAEGRGGGHRAAPPAAGEGGADERGEAWEAEEDLEQDVLAEGSDGSGGAGVLAAFRRRRIRRRSVSRHYGGGDAEVGGSLNPVSVARR